MIMAAPTLMGAVQRGATKAVTYFYLGTAGIGIERFQKLCSQQGQNCTLSEETVLCVALELKEKNAQSYHIAGFAFLNDNGKITILSDGFHREYVGEFAKEAIIYYERCNKR